MRLLLAKLRSAAAASFPSNSSAYTCHIRRHQPLVHGLLDDLLSSPWSATQLRCARFSGADVLNLLRSIFPLLKTEGEKEVMPSNDKNGDIETLTDIISTLNLESAHDCGIFKIVSIFQLCQVVKAQHTTQGRGGAIIQVELRDVDSGSKTNERLRTDEPVERVFVQEKSLTYLYTDDETGNVVLMDPETYGQLDVPSHLFGESLAYLQDDMKVTVQLYDERPMAASIPNRAICTVVEAADVVKGSGPMPYKRVLLDNGRTIQAPAHVLAGEKIIVSTTDNSYIGKA